MNLDALTAGIASDPKKALFAGAAVVVGGFALYKRHQANAAGSSASSTPTTSAGVVPYSGGGQTTSLGGAAGIYDSTSADLAGYLGPQLEAINGAIAALQSAQASPTPVAANPTPTASPAPAPAPAVAQAAPVPVAAGPSYAVDQWYTVQPKDTLSGIAARYPQRDITAQSIYGANRGVIGSDINLIRPGERLHIQG